MQYLYSIKARISQSASSSSYANTSEMGFSLGLVCKSVSSLSLCEAVVAAVGFSALRSSTVYSDDSAMLVSSFVSEIGVY